VLNGLFFIALSKLQILQIAYETIYLPIFVRMVKIFKVGYPMKSIITLFKLVTATIVAGVLPIESYAGSIQVMAPSTSKIEVIGTKKGTSIVQMGVKKSARAQKHEMQPEPKSAKIVKTAPLMPKMRTGEVELPMIPVSQTESN